MKLKQHPLGGPPGLTRRGQRWPPEKPEHAEKPEDPEHPDHPEHSSRKRMVFSRFDTPQMVESYRRLLISLRSVTDQPADAPMTSHWPVVGGDYSGDLLIVGQAVFGWIPRWPLSEIDVDAGVLRVLNETRSPLNDREDPMSWIATNSHRGSPFWRAVSLISDAIGADANVSWHSRIAWTNLYPVSRNEPAGNPYGHLLDLQTEPAAEFLRQTVSALKPRLVLVVGGPLWWGFATLLGLDGMRTEDRPLLRSGDGLGTRWVVGWHPAGAQRRGFRVQTYADRVVAALTQPTPGPAGLLPRDWESKLR